jgi:hypothetical protein
MPEVHAHTALHLLLLTHLLTLKYILLGVALICLRCVNADCCQLPARGSLPLLRGQGSADGARHAGGRLDNAGVCC